MRFVANKLLYYDGPCVVRCSRMDYVSDASGGHKNKMRIAGIFFLLLSVYVCARFEYVQWAEMH